MREHVGSPEATEVAVAVIESDGESVEEIIAGGNEVRRAVFIHIADNRRPGLAHDSIFSTIYEFASTTSKQQDDAVTNPKRAIWMSAIGKNDIEMGVSVEVREG